MDFTHGKAPALIPSKTAIYFILSMTVGIRKAVSLELEKAILLAEAEKATLLVVKLDRVSSSVAFISNLIEDMKL